MVMMLDKMVVNVKRLLPLSIMRTIVVDSIHDVFDKIHFWSDDDFSNSHSIPSNVKSYNSNCGNATYPFKKHSNFIINNFIINNFTIMTM